MRICAEQYPETTQITDNHIVKCWIQHPGVPKVMREVAI
jgi:oligopeptide transport system ATP-binding protein